MYLQAMLHGMGLIEDRQLRQFTQLRQTFTIQGDVPQRGSEGLGTASGQAVKTGAMGGAEQNDPGDLRIPGA